MLEGTFVNLFLELILKFLTIVYNINSIFNSHKVLAGSKC